MEDKAISLNDVIDVMHEMWGDSGELLDAIKERMYEQMDS